MSVGQRLQGFAPSIKETRDSQRVSPKMSFHFINFVFMCWSVNRRSETAKQSEASGQSRSFAPQLCKTSDCHIISHLSFPKQTRVTVFRSAALQNKRESHSFVPQLCKTSDCHRVWHLSFAKRTIITEFRTFLPSQG